jgi:sugar phosphate isomerase/epimerase
MYLTGFADEAAAALAGQIKATQTLGWKAIESRNIDGQNIHDLDDAAFEKVYAQLQTAGIGINCFGSAIANWAKNIRKVGDFERDLEQTRRAIPRMQRLGTRLVRVMSYAVLPQTPAWDQLATERFSRLREITGLFLDAGIQPVHENCMNYGGMGWTFTLRLLDNVPGLKLVYDTGNPIFTVDRTRPEPMPCQSSWEFYSHVREHVAYVHIKDGTFDQATGKTIYSWPGEGHGDVVRICEDLLRRGYDGGISIEPHMGAVFHDPTIKTDDEARFAMYVEYGRRMEKILADARRRIQPA